MGRSTRQTWRAPRVGAASLPSHCRQQAAKITAIVKRVLFKEARVSLKKMRGPDADPPRCSATRFRQALWAMRAAIRTVLLQQRLDEIRKIFLQRYEEIREVNVMLEEANCSCSHAGFSRQISSNFGVETAVQQQQVQQLQEQVQQLQLQQHSSTEVIAIRQMLHVLGEENASTALATQKGQEALAYCVASFSKLQKKTSATLVAEEVLAGQMLKSIAKAQATIRRVSTSRAQAVYGPFPQCDNPTSSFATATSSFATATLEQTCSPSLDLASTSSQTQGRSTSKTFKSCEALEEAVAIQRTLQSHVSSMTNQALAEDVCTSQEVLEDVEPTHEAAERHQQETLAGFAISAALEKALSNRRYSCPAAPGGIYAAEADTGADGVETQRLMAEPMVPSTPSGSRRPQSAGIVRFRRERRLSHAWSRAMVNSVLDSTEVMEQHRREWMAASLSSVTGPRRQTTRSKVQRGGVAAGTLPVPRDARRRPSEMLSALHHMASGENLVQDYLNQSLKQDAFRVCSPPTCDMPRDRQRVKHGKSAMSPSGFERAQHAAEVVAAVAAQRPVEKVLHRDWRRHLVRHAGQSPAPDRH